MRQRITRQTKYPLYPLEGLRLRMDWHVLLSNIALAGWLAADIVRIIVFAGAFSAGSSLGMIDCAEMAVLAMAAFFVLLRPHALNQDTSPSTIAIALSATLLPLIYVIVGIDGRLPLLSVLAQGVAILLMGASLLSLKRNFSILPQYRSIVVTGPYRLVRHPIYSSYLLFDGALVFGVGNLLGVMLWITEFGLLAVRAQCEERLLAGSSPEYACYRVAIRWRFLPYVH